MLQAKWGKPSNRKEPHGGGGHQGSIRTNKTSSSQPQSTRRRNTRDEAPLALQFFESPGVITSQTLSPLYQKIPAEIRELIWQFALLRYEDLQLPFDPSKQYCRPGQIARLRIAVELLLTCRAIYVETFLLPFILNPITVFDNEEDDQPPGQLLKGTPATLGRSLKLYPWQFASINEVDITASQMNLEGGTLDRISRMVGALRRHSGSRFEGFALTGYPIMTHVGTADPKNPLSDLCACRRITRLTIRLNRTDWWSWGQAPKPDDILPNDDKLRLEPLTSHTRSGANKTAMERGFTARIRGLTPDFLLDAFEKQGRWGVLLQEFWPDLQVFELAMETFAAKTDQLKHVVECAKLWTFPMEPGYQLQWSGKAETKEWQGAALYGYEPLATWVIERAAGDTASKESARSIFRRIKNSKQKPRRPLEGQKFIIKTMTYERRKAPTASSSDKDS